MRQKQTFAWVVVILVLGLMLLPFVTAFNDAITRAVIQLRGYKWVAEVVVPMEVKWIVVVLRLLGVQAYAAGEYVRIDKLDDRVLVEVIWNCIGWQSLVSFIITTMVGLRGGYTWASKLKAMLLGIFGTILTNILRIVIVILFFIGLDYRIAAAVHEYGALLTNTAWLIGYWWFVYRFVLEERI